MFRTFIIPALLICFIQSSLYGQDEPKNEPNNFKHAIGVAAGFTTGYGISYRYYPGRFGIQATFAPYKDEHRTQISAGITFLYSLIEGERTALYLYQGNHYFYDDYSGYSQYNTYEKENYLNMGIGMGIEFLIFKRVSFNLMGGYAGLENFNRITLTGETGLFFKF